MEVKPPSVWRRVLCTMLSAVFPQVCEVCGRTLVRGESHVCLGCLAALPRTMTHRDPDSRMLSRLSRVAPVDRCAAWFYYDPGGPFGALIRRAKYDGRPSMARDLGAMFARELLADSFFDGIDLLVPVPLHWRRRMERGYNQSREIARGVSDVTGIPVSDALCALRAHGSQTRLSGDRRQLNVRGVYALRPASGSTPATFFRHFRSNSGDKSGYNPFAGKHILLIDDIFTTGATAESALAALMASPAASSPSNTCAPNLPNPDAPRAVSVLTLGLTRDHVR